MSVTPAPDSAAKTLATAPSAAVSVSSDLVIKGLTLDGQQFRPSDWSDRLCGVMSAFGADEQLRYSPLVQPALRDGIRCVIVKAELGALEPRLFKFFLSFAVENELQITYDADAVATLLPAAAKKLSVDGPPVVVRSAKSEDY
ncbi:MAG: DUF3579 domain-containing protein [Burkholderiales bacterium]|nr:MAG: DUF3579 domain-containing protein [Betaproteobacteria bacterium]TAG28430.1 MAG: DUF3579 domain-containing protein [Burkholderiales bacterium]